MKKIVTREIEVIFCDDCKQEAILVCDRCNKDLCHKCSKKMGILPDNFTVCKNCRKIMNKVWKEGLK